MNNVIKNDISESHNKTSLKEDLCSYCAGLEREEGMRENMKSYVDTFYDKYPEDFWGTIQCSGDLERQVGSYAIETANYYFEKDEDARFQDLLNDAINNEINLLYQKYSEGKNYGTSKSDLISILEESKN